MNDTTLSLLAAEAAELNDDPELRASNIGWVYVARLEGQRLVKIGWSEDPCRRAADLRAGSGGLTITCLVQIRGTRALERSLHARFRKQYSSGEWFRLVGPLARWLDSISNGLDFETTSARKSARARIAKARINEWDDVL